MSSNSAILHVMSKAADKAAFVIVRDFGELERLQISRKGLRNFVTSSDKNSESRIIYELSKARPGFSFICEESGFSKNENTDSIWIVDPIDGTNNFMRGIPYFAINIALMENNEFIAGVTLDPMKGDCFKASLREGAYVGNRDRLRVSGREQLREAVVALKTTFEIEEKIFVEGAIIRKTGSTALDLAYLAAGKYDAVIVQNVMLWDIASGIVLIKEAGGFLEYVKKEDGRYDIFAASSSKLLNYILKFFSTLN